MTKKVTTIFYALLIATICSSLVFYPGFHFPFQTAKVFLFLVLVDLALPFYLYLLFKKPELRNIYKNKITIALLLFLFAMIVSGIFGVDPLNSFLGNSLRKTGVVLYLHMGLFSIYVSSLFLLSKQLGQRLLKIIVFLGTLAGLHGILEFTRTIPSFYGTGRTAGLFGNPIFFASFLIIPLFLAIHFALKTKSKTSLAYYLSAAFMFLGIVSTGTRGALVGVIAGLLTWLGITVITKTKNKKQILAIGIASIVGLILLFSIAKTILPNDTFLNRLTQFSSTSASSRINYWQIGLVGWKDAPILGVGTENFYVIADKYFTDDLYKFAETWPDKPHNQLIEFLDTLGIVGFGLYLALLFFLFKTLFKNGKQNRLLLAALVAYLIQNMFAFDTVATMITFFLLIGAINSNNEQNKITEKKTNPIVKQTIIGLSIIMSVFLIVTAHYPNTKMDPETVAREHGKAFNQGINSGKLTQNEIDNLFKKTIDQYEYTLELHPLRARYWNELSRIYLIKALAEKTTIDQKGIEASEKTLELAPNRVEAKLFQVLLLKQEGKSEKATKLLETIIENHHEHAEASWTLAGFYFEQGKIDEAAALGFKAMKKGLSLSNPNSMNWLIEYYVQKKDYEKIIIIYQNAITKQPDMLLLYSKLATAYALNGQKDKAIQTAKLLLKKDPSSESTVNAFIEQLQ